MRFINTHYFSLYKIRRTRHGFLPFTGWGMRRYAIMFAIMVSMCMLTAAASTVMLMDLDTGLNYDITTILQQITGVSSVKGVTALNAVPGNTADTWLLIAGDDMLVFLDAATLQPLFTIPETALRNLFGLSPGTGSVSAFQPAGQPVDTLLYFDSLSGSCYGIDLFSGTSGLYSTLEFPEPFYTGFKYSASHDIGLVLRDSSEDWWYETLPERERIHLNLTALFGAPASHFSEFIFNASGTPVNFVISVLDAYPEPTPTPTPGPGTPTATATPGDSPEYDVVIAMGLGETLWRIDAQNYATERDAALTGQAPAKMLLHQSELFVINSLSHSITVYDPVSLSLKRELSAGIGTSPFDIVFINSNEFYVTQFTTNTVSRIDAYTGNILAEIPMPVLPSDPGKTTAARPSGITLIDGIAFVACANLDTSFFPGGPGVTVLIDSATNQVVNTFESHGRNTVNIMGSPVNPARIWVINAGDFSGSQGFHLNGTVSVFSLPGLDLITSIQTGDAPMDMVFGHQRAYYSSGADGRIGRINPDALELLTPIELPTGGHGLNMVSGLAAGPDNRLWVLDFNNDNTFVLDMNRDDTIIQQISVGWGPDALAIVERQ